MQVLKLTPPHSRYYHGQQGQQQLLPPGQQGRVIATGPQQQFGGPYGGAPPPNSPMNIGNPNSGGVGGVGGFINQVGSVVGSAVSGAVEGARTDPNLQKVGSDIESKWIQLQTGAGQMAGQVVNTTKDAWQNLKTNVAQGFGQQG